MRKTLTAITAVLIIGTFTGCQSAAEKQARRDAEEAAVWYCPVEPPSWSDDHDEYEQCISDEADRIMEEDK